ncbi:tegument protein [Macropodid alphaherpesvirus 1]|uniref:Tegument protein n=1 Tax=Macropodid alphaherpesvirus 1 TaxID=137443 RepID=A0A120HUI8_9ALPH|nr:tegument protein [Macropodid alphaherpesvirus 1]AMB17017.1 tegument protein [Macropodid alphaherpesvirus 1]
MEIVYASTHIHNNVILYFTEDEQRAYFVCGGCVYSLGRPQPDQPSELVKFGLVVRGTRPQDLTIANYVRSETRRNLKTLGCVTEDAVFLDRVYFLNPTISSEADIINCTDVDIFDECLKDYLTTKPGDQDIRIIGVHIREQDKILEIRIPPLITDAETTIVYPPAPHAFGLAHVRLRQLPPVLAQLLHGLFESFPLSSPEDPDPPRRTEILITGPQMACTIPGELTDPRGPKRTTFSEFVQVKHIDRIGTQKFSRARGLGQIPYPSLAELWLVFCEGDRALFTTPPPTYLTPTEECTRTLLVKQAALLFGTPNSPRAFLGNNLPLLGQGETKVPLTPLQKMAAYYFLIQRIHRGQIFPLLVKLVTRYVDACKISVPPICEYVLGDILNSLFRDALLSGLLAEQLIRGKAWTHAAFAIGNDIKLDSLAVLQRARALTASSLRLIPPSIQPQHIHILGALLNALYAGHSRLSAITYVARLTGETSLVFLAGTLNRVSALDPVVVRSDTGIRAVNYLAALLSSQIANITRKPTP